MNDERSCLVRVAEYMRDGFNIRDASRLVREETSQRPELLALVDVVAIFVRPRLLSDRRRHAREVAWEFARNVAQTYVSLAGINEWQPIADLIREVALGRRDNWCDQERWETRLSDDAIAALAAEGGFEWTRAERMGRAA